MLRLIEKTVVIIIVAVSNLAHTSDTFAQRLNTKTYNARGVVEAIDRATLSSGITSKVTKIGFRKGQSFSKGELLVQFSCEREKAATNSAFAAYQGAKQSYEKDKELLTYEATGRFDVEISKAEMDQAFAEYNGQKAVSDQCKIIAPYDGSVVSSFINTHETPQSGQPLMEIVSNQLLEVTMIAPSAWLSWLVEGQEFTFHIDDTGHTELGQINRVGAVVDPVSQTIEIIGVINNPSTALRPGMGGEGQFSMPAGG